MIRWNDVALAPGPNGTHIGKVQIELLAFDHTGKPVNWNGGTQEMQLAPELYAAVQRSGIPAHFEIDLPRVPINLEAGVHDLTTGKVGDTPHPSRSVESHRHCGSSMTTPPKLKAR